MLSSSVFVQFFSTLLQYIGPTDVLDILATSVLIYYLLVLISGTRAVQILIGVLVLVGLLGLANLLHLYLLGSILQIIVVGAAVTLPIVFQPELRRALEQIGRGGLFRMASEQASERFRAEDPSITTVANAAFLLSRSNMGALIVMEQHTGLREFVESGTILGARLSAELLITLFMRPSPLHDGAVIVRDDVIEAAGCFLPLGEQRALAERRVGTRHRAAIGLTEQTDAVVVVVSEENGAVSIAREGKLSRPVEDEARLTKMLLAMTREPRAARLARMQHALPRMQHAIPRMQQAIPADWVTHLRTRLFPSRSPNEEQHGDHSEKLRT